MVHRAEEHGAEAELWERTGKTICDVDDRVAPVVETVPANLAEAAPAAR